MKTAHDIILKPVITENSMAGIADKKYTFKVATDATKVEIAQAVEVLFPGVKVSKVNTISVRGRFRRQGMHAGYTAASKKAIVTMTKALACAERVASVFDIGADAAYVGAQDQKLADKVDKSAPFLDFKHVSLTYQGAGAPTLQDMNFTVNRGDTVGIIGGTGSGKTSLVNLIPGFYPATEGEILLEGRDIRTMSDEELRGRIGVVPQKAVLFKGTIRSNLQWGKPDATEEEMWKALELAQASEVVEGKDGKLDATVAQNGKNFSGGQRQRLTIARALVREPEILILDDSASALDYATDAKLRAALRTLEDKTTTFIVSQRASTIRHADKIIVLDDGEIAGMGTHDELLKDCTVYQEIYYSQYPEQRGGVR